MTTELADSADPVPDVDPAELAVDDAVYAAERLLTTRLGARICLADPEDLGGSGRATVLRVRVVRTPFTLPRTLVVKHSPARSTSGTDPFAQEAASCQLFNALRREDRPGPELIACDPQARLLVLEDLGRSGTVAGMLNSTGPTAASRAEQALLGWAHALGRLHATTRGYEADFAALLRRLGAPQVADPLTEHSHAAVAGLPTVLESELGIHSPPEAVAESRRTAQLLDSQPYRAFSPADLGPDNAVVGSTVRFIDFEGGCFRTALLDAAQLRAPLPSSTAALALPPGMADAMVSAWHAEVVGVWPELRDRAVFDRRLLDGQLLWTWLCTWWLLATPNPWAATGVAELNPTEVPDRGAVLVDRWERLAVEAEVVGAEATCTHATLVAEALRRRFRVTGNALPWYPVFR